MSDEASSAAPPRRPGWLWIALVTLTFFGVSTLAEGWAAIQLTRQPLPPEPALPLSDHTAVLQAALLRSMASQPGITLPLGVAQCLLGGLLLFLALRASFGRNPNRPLLVQAVVAHVALASVGYYLRQPVRGDVVEALVASGLAPRPPGYGDDQLRAQLWWSFRFWFGIQIGALVFSGLALTRPGAREALAARPAEEPEG